MLPEPPSRARVPAKTMSSWGAQYCRALGAGVLTPHRSYQLSAIS